MVEAPVRLIEKIPTLSDEEVLNLLANARRLQTEGDDKQRSMAAELIDPLETAAAERELIQRVRIGARRVAGLR